MKKLLIVAVAALCFLFVSCDADSIQKTSKGLQDMAAMNFASDEVKEDSLNYIKQSLVTELKTKQEAGTITDIKSQPIDDTKLLSAFFYIAALAVNDVDQKEQESKLRSALAEELCANSLNEEPGKTLSEILNDIIYRLDHAEDGEVVQEINDLLASFGVSGIPSVSNIQTQIARISKIVRALMPAASGFDKVKANIQGRPTCTMADYMTYWMSVMMMKEVADFISGSETSVVSILNSDNCDAVLAYIHAIEVINNVDFDFPAIVSGLSD